MTGKVSDVIRTNGSSKPDLHFDYDAMGQRISKTVTNKNTTDGTDKFVTTYYMRDPRGNVLAVYEHKHGDSGNGTFTLTEQHLYGSGRLGMKKRDLALNVANASEPTPVTHYELTNHLGNVMAVISDKASSTAEPTVVSLSDYYPFGMTEPGRSWISSDYRFGYTGHEKESDLAEGVYTTEYRLLDTRLGRWMSVDPLAGDFAWMSPYVYCGGNPVEYYDPEGMNDKEAGKGGVRIVLDMGGSPDLYDAAQTRIEEIKKNYPNDKLVVITDGNLSNLKKNIETELSKAQEEGYGYTKEFSVFSHNAADGPIGEYNKEHPENYPLSLGLETGSHFEDGQLSLKNWKAINFNFDKANSIAVFYGCRGETFAINFLEATSVNAVAFNTGPAGGTYSYEGDFNITIWNILNRNVYMRSAEGGKVDPMWKYTKGDKDKDGYYNVQEVSPNPTVP